MCTINSKDGSVGFGFGAGVYKDDTNEIFGVPNINLYGPYYNKEHRFHTDAGLVAVCNNALEALVGLANRKYIAGGSNVLKDLLDISYKADSNSEAARLFSRTIAVIEQLWGNTYYYNNRYKYLYKLGVLAGKLCDDIEAYLFNSKSFEFGEGFERDDKLLEMCSKYIENSCYVYFDEYDGLIGCGFRYYFIDATARYFGEVSENGNGWVPFPETSQNIVEVYEKIMCNIDNSYFKLFAFTSGSDKYNMDKIISEYNENND